MNLRSFSNSNRTLGTDSYSSAYPPNGSSKVKKLLVVIVVLVIVSSILLIGTQLTKPKTDAKGIASTFVSKVVSNKPEDSYQLTAYPFKLRDTPDEWKKTVNNISGTYTSKPKFISEKPILDTQNTKIGQQENFEIEGKDGTYNVVVQLVQEDKVWKVAYFNATKNSL